MLENISLRGRVLDKYKSVSEFARAVKWTRNKAARILYGKQSPSDKEIVQIASALGIDSPEVFMRIFFNDLSTKWTKE